MAAYGQAVVAESLYLGWDPATKSYRMVSHADRTWLLERLNHARDRFGLQVIVIDYVPPKKRSLARQVAERISELGFTPWVANPSLDILGVGAVEVFPRRMLGVYDNKEQSSPGFENSNLHRLLAPRLAYLGYSIEYLDVQDDLPSHKLFGQYAGIITWFTDEDSKKPSLYRDWLLRQLDEGPNVAILGRLGFAADPVLLQRIGVKAVAEPLERPVKIKTKDQLICFVDRWGYPALLDAYRWQVVDPHIMRHLTLEDNAGRHIDLVVTTRWGGIALNPYVFDFRKKPRQRWIINPYQFLIQALELR